MPRRTLLIPVMLLATAAAQAQAPAHPLGAFATRTGEWAGEAWMIRGPGGRVAVQQHEWVGHEAGGHVITVRGLGTIGSDTVHHAFAVIHRAQDGSGLLMRAFTAEGRWIDPEIVATEHGYTWTMRDPRIGLVKYEQSFDEEDRWIENGFFSRDEGKTWTQFMGMVLARR